MKELTFDQEARQRLLHGIEEIAKAVGSTLGPLGSTVVIEDQATTRGVKITKDGVTVAKSIELEDPIANMAVTIVREASERTASSAGDGTTTSIVLAEAMVRYGMERIKADPTLNVTNLIRDIRERVDRVCDRLKESAIAITDENIINVATISSNNDPVVGSMIADVFKEIGPDGSVKVDKSKTSKTSFKVFKGLKVDRGYTSPLFINNRKTGECVMDGCHIMVTDITINSLQEIQSAIEPIVAKKEPLLIIGTLSQEMINLLGANVIKNKLPICHIEVPSFGYKSKDLMEDIAIATNAGFISETTGDDLTLMSAGDLGYADRVIVGQHSTVIVPSGSERSTARAEELKAEYESADADKAFLKERIAKLSGAVGIIYAGGESDIEQKELYDRLEDASLAVEAAMEQGILPGGGVALMEVADELPDVLSAPYERIFTNGGLEPREYEGGGVGWDLSKMIKGNMIDMGVIDPAKVTINALRNATSVATTILSTSTTINYVRKTDS